MTALGTVDRFRLLVGLVTCLGCACSPTPFVDPVDPPPYDPNICTAGLPSTCVTPEGLPRRLHPDDPDFGRCLEWGVADLLPVGARKGRLPFALVRDLDGVMTGFELECGLSRTLIHSFSYDEQGRFTRWEAPAVPEATVWGPQGWAAMTFTYEHEDGVPARRLLRTMNGEDVFEQINAVTYDPRGYLARVTNVSGGTSSSRHIHDDEGRLLEAAYHDEYGEPETPSTVVSYSYEGDRLVRVDYVTIFFEAQSVTATLEWDGEQLAGVRATFDSGLDTELTFSRDEQGRVAEREIRTDDGELISRTSYAYDDALGLVGWEYWGYHTVDTWGTDEW